MKTKFISALTALAIIFSLMPTVLADNTLYPNWTAAAEAAVQGTDYTQSGEAYTIKTAKGLAWFANAVNNGQTSINATLANDIDLSGVVDDRVLSEENSWIPIAKDTNRSFSGTFDGNGHTISGMKIKSEQMYQGLFGIIGQSGTASDVKIDNAELNVQEIDYTTCEMEIKASCVGGIVGHNNGLIKNCESKTHIAGEYIGGIAGENYGEIYGCKSDSTLKGISNVGIITGCNFEGKGIENCESKGTVTGVINIGGISGDNASSTIRGCKNYANVTGQLWVGGITGITSYNSLVTDCQNAGEVTSKYISTFYIWNIGEVGGITGRVDSQQGFSQVKQCYNSGSIKCEGADSLNAGGIVGCSYYGGVISDCVNDGAVTAKDWNAGGIAGDFDSDLQNMDKAKLVNCVNNGEIHARKYAGGIAGANVATIENSYNTGNVQSDNSNAGGIAGVNASASDGKNIHAGSITNCYTTGTVTAPEGMGAITGDNFQPSNITGCYYPEGQQLSSGSGSVTDCASYDANNTVTGGKPLYEALNDGVNRYGADYWKPWRASDDAPAEFAGKFNNWTEAGEAAEVGTDYAIDGDTYTVYTPLGLAFIANTVNGGNNLQGKTVLLANDINLAGVVDDFVLDDENSWNPIGDYNIEQPNNRITDFDGIFDGQNHTVSGMKINRETGNQGLFGYIFIHGEVRNLGVINSSITVNDSFSSGTIEYNGLIAAKSGGGIKNCYTGENTSISANGYYVGGIVGRNHSLRDNILENCSNMATVTAKRGHAGGIAADNSNSLLLKNCSNKGTITSEMYAGGIAGEFSSASNIEPVMMNCYNEGHVSALNAGGIVGWNSSYNRRLYIINSYNTGDITAKTYAGGIVSDCRDMSDIINCYNSGNITSAKNNAGSIIGSLGNQNTQVSNCYYLSSSSAKPIGVTKTAYEPTNCYMFDENGVILGSEKSLCDALNDGVHTLNNEDAFTWTRGDGFAEFGDLLSESKELLAVKLSKQPASTYIQGQKFNPEGMIITLMYANGSQTDVAYTEETKDSFTFTPSLDTALATTGTEVEVTYDGKSVLIPITVTEKNMTGINVSSLPNKTTYIEGEELDTTGIEVTASYDNGTSETINSFDVSGYDKNEIGNQNVTVTFGGLTASFTVTVKAKSVTGIAIVSEPAQKEYTQGTPLNLAGLVVRADYNNGTSAVITDYTVEGYDKTTTGTQTITVSYGGFTAEFNVTVIKKTMTGISLDTSKIKTSLIENESLVAKELIVNAVYDNGTTEQIPITSCKLTGYNKKLLGVQTVTVEYYDEETRNTFSAQFDVTVAEKTLVGIKILLAPPKVEYIEGEELDTTGLVVWAQFDNGRGQNVLATVTGYDKNKIGTQLISVEYGGFTAEYTVTVYPKEMTELTITQLPIKRTYLEGEVLNLNGMTVRASYNNGTSEEVTSYVVDEFDRYRIGEQEIEVKYGGMTATFTVEVQPKSMTFIKVAKKPDRTNYIIGQELDLTGMELMAYYNNGTAEPVTEYTVTGYDKDTLGTQTVTIEHNGFTATTNVTVVDRSITDIVIAAPPTKTEYIEGQDLELAGLVVTANYDNGTSGNVTGYDITGYDKNTAGEQTVTVAYAGKTAEFKVNVAAKTLQNIMITRLPDKTEYIEDERDELDLSGISIIANYDNGISEEVDVNDCELSVFDNVAIGMQVIVLTYRNTTASFNVNVVPKKLTQLSITNMPEQIIYKLGQELNVSGMAVTASYDNGKSEVIKDYEIKGFEKDVTGRQTVFVAYGSMIDSFNVIVMDNTPRLEAVAEYDDNTSTSVVTVTPQNCEAGTVIAALYKDNVLIKLQTVEYNGTTAPSPIVTNNVIKPDRVKVMLWNSLEGMKQLCGATDVTVQAPIV